MKRMKRWGKELHHDGRMSLRLRLVLLVALELVVSILLAVWLGDFLNNYIFIDWEIPLLLTLMGISVLIGIFVTAFLSRLFFDPIKKLQQAMGKVAQGDFTVNLDNKSASPEIRDIYSGFNLMTQELRATEILQSDFVSNVSHEFKTPINAIEGYATLLQGCEGLTPDQQVYVDKIIGNTQRLSILTGSILLLSKLENQQILTNQTRFSLDEQIRQAIVALEPAWEQRQIQFDVEMDAVSYYGSEHLMHHVWSNLLSNAIKFSPQGGTVRIRLRKQGDGLQVRIEDEGPGIPQEALAHIFHKFYQVDSSHKQEGNGLGLALVEKILTLERGAVSAENLKPQGCRFTVTLENRN